MKQTLVLIALFLGTVAPAAAVEARRSYSATAFSLDSGEILYVEKHVETWREGRLAERVVSYTDPSGNSIAEKVVRYGESVEAPSFDMVDSRLGLREGARVEGEQVVLYSASTRERARERRMDKPQVAVVDAGFDAFMNRNFAAVLDGESIEFEFAVPALRRFFRFELQPQGEVTYEGQAAVLVKMRPAAAILRLLVDPIDLVYSREGRLLEFRGLANVCDEDGDRYEARIVFDYPPAMPEALQLGVAP